MPVIHSTLIFFFFSFLFYFSMFFFFCFIRQALKRLFFTHHILASHVSLWVCTWLQAAPSRGVLCLLIDALWCLMLAAILYTQHARHSVFMGDMFEPQTKQEYKHRKKKRSSLGRWLEWPDRLNHTERATKKENIIKTCVINSEWKKLLGRHRQRIAH